MFALKKLSTPFILLVTLSFGCSVFNVFARDTILEEQDKLIIQVEQLFEQNYESLPANEVMLLSNKVISQRQKYPKAIIAKTYLLLANIALNKGEIDTAYQFIQDGIVLTQPNQTIQLCLQITLAKVLIQKKQYKKLLTVTEQVINSSVLQPNSRTLLLALSYRSVAFAMLSQHSKALADLKKVQQVLKQHPTFVEHVALLAILADAYYHLNDFQTALTIQLKVLKLRFSLNELDNVNQTYFQLGNAYFQLNRFDDAYNAFWEAKRYAQIKDAPIHTAYAIQGLALTLLKQEKYLQAQVEFLRAKELFHSHNLTIPCVEVLISLAKISQLLAPSSQNFDYLLTAEKKSANIILTKEYSILYQMLATMYLAKSEIDKAYFWQEKYSDALLNNQLLTKFTHVEATIEQSVLASAAARKLAVKLSEQSELTNAFSGKYQQQEIMILMLSLIIVLYLLRRLFIWGKQRTIQSRHKYDEQEIPGNILSTPTQTKQLYLTNFNMARKYSYPFTLGYISLSNWTELAFKFNTNTLDEVRAGIAELINEHLDDFELAGEINGGEYLLIFPHQNKDQVMVTMNKILQTIPLRSFANLGEYSVGLAYAMKSQDFQDIDPYIFLSNLSDSIKSL